MENIKSGKRALRTIFNQSLIISVIERVFRTKEYDKYTPWLLTLDRKQLEQLLLASSFQSVPKICLYFSIPRKGYLWAKKYLPHLVNGDEYKIITTEDGLRGRRYNIILTDYPVKTVSGSLHFGWNVAIQVREG